MNGQRRLYLLNWYQRHSLGYNGRGYLMPRKKGVAKIATMIMLVPTAKLALERLSEKTGRPASYLVEDLVMQVAESRGVMPTPEEVEAWLASGKAGTE